MLNLTREAGQSVTIAGYITIHIRKCESGRVELGIDAPRTVPVYRTEKAAEREAPPPLPMLPRLSPLGQFRRRVA